MNDSDEKILELYLSDLRKRRFITITIFMICIAIFTILINKQNIVEENQVTNLVLVNSISNENITEKIDEILEIESTNIIEETQLDISSKEETIIQNNLSKIEKVNIGESRIF